MKKEISEDNLLIEGENFIINYNKKEKSCINEVMSLLESKYKVIIKNLNQELYEKVKVKICSNKEELQKELGIEGVFSISENEFENSWIKFLKMKY